MGDGIRNRGLTRHARIPRLEKPLTKKQAEIIAEAEKDRAKTDGNNIQFLKVERAERHRRCVGEREQQCDANQRKQAAEADQNRAVTNVSETSEVVAISPCMLCSICSTYADRPVTPISGPPGPSSPVAL